MSTLALWIHTGTIGDEDVVLAFDDFDILVVDLGLRTEADVRTELIREQLAAESLVRLRWILGPNGERCTYQTSDLTQEHRYNEFDLLFKADKVSLSTVQAGVAALIVEWRSRRQPRQHMTVLPYTPVADDSDEDDDA